MYNSMIRPMVGVQTRKAFVKPGLTIENSELVPDESLT